MENRTPHDLKSLWNQTVKPLEASLPGEDFDTWIEPMRPVEYGDGILEISVPNRMFAA
jgi:chromosomal replication initiation ATPase DnaA